MGTPLTGPLRLKADLAAEFGLVDQGQNPVIAGATNRPASIWDATAPTNNIQMGALETGWRQWSDYGGRIYSSFINLRGYAPFSIPYGTFRASGYTSGSSLEFSKRNSRVLLPVDQFLSSGKQNISMSNYRGTFLPYFGRIKVGTVGSSASQTATYALGRGKYWIQASLIGGGGGGGGGDNQAGGAGGSGSQMDACFYVASDSTSQVIKIITGGGGAGGLGNINGRTTNLNTQAAGGAGYAAGGKGGTQGGSGASGNGGGGGGSSAIVWYPQGTGSTGYLIMMAGGGGGGGGGGRYGPTSGLTSGQRTFLGEVGGYSIVPINYKNVWPAASGVGNADGTYSVSAGLTTDAAVAATPGYDAIRGTEYYTTFYKPYFMDPPTNSAFFDQIFLPATGQGGASNYLGRWYGYNTDAERNTRFTDAIDSGGGGGGGGGFGNPGFHTPFGIFKEVDIYTVETGNLYFDNLAYDFNGSGGAAGYCYIRPTFTATSFEYAWRNIGPRETFLSDPTSTGDGGTHVPIFAGQGPINRSLYASNSSNYGRGGNGGAGASGVQGQNGSVGNAGAAIVLFTTADHEGGMYNNETF